MKHKKIVGVRKAAFIRFANPISDLLANEFYALSKKLTEEITNLKLDFTVANINPEKLICLYLIRKNNRDLLDIQIDPLGGQKKAIDFSIDTYKFTVIETHYDSFVRTFWTIYTLPKLSGNSRYEEIQRLLILNKINTPSELLEHQALIMKFPFLFLSDYLLDGNDDLAIDFVIKQESLTEDLDTLCRILNIPNINISQNKHELIFKNELTDTAKRTLDKLYQKDLLLLKKLKQLRKHEENISIDRKEGIIKAGARYKNNNLIKNKGNIKEFSFVHVPKTAGFFLQYAFYDLSKLLVKKLSNLDGYGFVGHQLINNQFTPFGFTYLIQNREGNLIKINCGHRRAVEFPKDSFKFSLVRDPYEKFKSEFSFIYDLQLTGNLLLKEMQDFYISHNIHSPSDILYQPLPIQQIILYPGTFTSFYLLDDEGNLDVDFVGRQENLEKDVEKLCDIMNIPRINTSKKKNVSFSKKYILTEENKEILRKIYANDFRLLDKLEQCKYIYYNKKSISIDGFSVSNTNIKYFQDSALLSTLPTTKSREELLTEKAKLEAQFREHKLENKAQSIIKEKITERLKEITKELATFPSRLKQRDGGSGQAVISAVLRDITTYNSLDRFQPMRWKLTSNVFSHPELYKPYGIPDNDYGKTCQLLMRRIDYRVSVIGHRSLDNYIFDPFILFSMLSEDEITNLVLKSRLNEVRKKDRKADKDAEVDRAVDTIVKKSTLLIACKEIKKALDLRSFSDIQRHLEVYFKFIFEMLLSNKFEEHEEEETTYDSIKKRFKEEDLCNYTMRIVISANRTIACKYPKEFLDVRGHDIENAFVGKKRRDNIDEHLVKKVITRVYQNGLIYIPLDLAVNLFDLNHKVRTNVRPVIKLGQPTLATCMASITSNLSLPSVIDKQIATGLHTAQTIGSVKVNVCANDIVGLLNSNVEPWKTYSRHIRYTGLAGYMA